LGSSTLILITGLIGLLSGATAGVFFAFTRDLPQIRELENFEPSAATRIYSADQVLLAELFLEKRTPVSIVQIPKLDLKSALIVTEDRQFYTHSGIDLKGILQSRGQRYHGRSICGGGQHHHPAVGQNAVLITRENDHS
jgi:penicillin-binding protein 1A